MHSARNQKWQTVAELQKKRKRMMHTTVVFLFKGTGVMSTRQNGKNTGCKKESESQLLSSAGVVRHHDWYMDNGCSMKQRVQPPSRT